MGILKSLKLDARPLLPAECDELILLIGGTIRPNHRPEVKIFGGSLRRGNWTAIADVVFSFLKNDEDLAQAESELTELNSAGFLEKVLRPVSAKIRANCRRELVERIPTERLYLENIIASLRPISAKKRAEAERMASMWFAKRGTKLTPKQIQNELSAIQQAAGLDRLGLAEWREIKAKHAEKCIAQAQALEEENRETQPNE